MSAPVAGRLVVLRALGLGDLLTGVPALRALARVFPHHHRMLLAPAALRPLVELVDVDGEPVVHEVVPHHGLGPLPAAARHADVAVNLHGRGPQSHRALRAARPTRLLAFACPEQPDPFAPAWRPREHEVVRWCRMLAAHGIPCDPGDLDLAVPDGVAVDPRAPGATLVHPGAKDAARRWPADRWAQVVRGERHAGREVLVTGGPGEEALAREVALLGGLEQDAALAGALDLRALAATVAAAGRVVCGDTGVAHLATAVGAPSVVLFGPTSPAEWGPPPDRAGRHVALWAGRRGDPHAGTPDPGLLELRPRDVAAALARLQATAAV